MRGFQNSLLDPAQVTICMIDYEPQMFFDVESTPRNAATGLTKTAQTFLGPLVSRIQSIFSDIVPIQHSMHGNTQILKKQWNRLAQINFS